MYRSPGAPYAAAKSNLHTSRARKRPLRHPGQVPARDRELRLAHTPSAAGRSRTGSPRMEMPVPRVGRTSPHRHQHLLRTDGRHRHLGQPQDILRRAVRVLHDRLHHVPHRGHCRRIRSIRRLRPPAAPWLGHAPSLGIIRGTAIGGLPVADGPGVQRPRGIDGACAAPLAGSRRLPPPLGLPRAGRPRTCARWSQWSPSLCRGRSSANRCASRMGGRSRSCRRAGPR